MIWLSQLRPWSDPVLKLDKQQQTKWHFHRTGRPFAIVIIAVSGQIPSNIDHQEGQHRADSGAPPAWASPAR
jgi:hypothetical protein